MNGEPDKTPDAIPGESHDGLWVLTFVIGMVALVVSIVAVIGAFGNESSAAASSGAAGSMETEFDITLGEMFVSPSTIEVAAGETITLNVTNTGAMAHDLKVMGMTGTDLLQPGESATVTIGPFTTDAQAWCSVPGHKEAGMLLNITVIGAAPVAAAAGSSATPAATAPTGATIDAQAEPASDWEPRDPVLEPAESGTVHEIALDATEEQIEVAPGVTQLMWTFGGQVPGPTLRGKIGDTFRVTLTNEGTMGHSIDFHASKVAWNDEMRTILPGESLVYEFTADHAGAFMYHCGTAPTLHHIGNGMFGAIIIDPPELEPVEQEFVLIQSELYLGAEGQPGDLGKMIDEDFDAVVFNGYHNQYKHAPIRVDADKDYRVWVIDDGPSENSAFHIVGTIFDTVFKEGSYLLRPDETSGGSQVLDLQPAQGGFVEFSFAEDGLYPFVTHKFSNAGKGALGFFAVGDVDTSALGSH